MNKKSLKTIIIISVVVLIIAYIPIFYFVDNFKGSSYSDDITKWGAFGDYFGGILNTFISFLSLIVTTFIAFQLMKIDNERQKENHTFEREKMLREFREAEYKRITYQLQKVQPALTLYDLDEAGSRIHDVIFHYKAFVESNSHLFDFLQDTEFRDLQKSLIALMVMIEKNKENYSDINYSDRPKKNDIIIRDFNDKEKIVHQKFQKYFINL